MSQIYIKIDFAVPEENAAGLDKMLKLSHRTKKNFCEALVMLATTAYKNGRNTIDLRELGVIFKDERKKIN